MTIDNYIKASRRTKEVKTLKYFKKIYKQYFDNLYSQLNNNINKPNFKVIYSMNRSCELIDIENKSYVIYDQYMGQSFNKLNKIRLYKKGRVENAKAYGCKVIAQKLLLSGHPHFGSFFALLSKSFENKIKKPKSIKKLELKRNQLIVIQEIYIMAHELSHFIYNSNDKNSNSLKKLIKDDIIEFIESKNDKLTNEEVKEIGKRYGKKIGKLSNTYGSESKKSYLEVLNKDKDNIISESFADNVGAMLTIEYASKTLHYSSELISEGIIIAFKYLRLFKHLNNATNHIIKILELNDKQSFEDELENLSKNIWDEEGKNIQFTQLREHFLRSRLRIILSINDKNENKVHSQLCDIVDIYDKNIEFPIIIDLMQSLENKLTFKISEELKNSDYTDEKVVGMIDMLTGWER